MKTDYGEFDPHIWNCLQTAFRAFGRDGINMDWFLWVVRKELIRNARVASGGNMEKASKRLEISRRWADQVMERGIETRRIM